ncbi:Magnesium transport protein CorA [bacterium HR34]|nr:Magnesium transport protein CorA [bacterium HR34]
MLVQIFYEINNDYSKFIAGIEKAMRNVAINLEKIDNKDIVRFVQFERILNDFYSSLNANELMLENVLSGKYFSLYEADKDLIEDLFISNKQLLQRTNLLLKSIVNARESYSTIMQNNLNKTIKFLTAITIIFTIPTMIASIYGMNLSLPLQQSPFAFIIVVLIIFFVSLLSLVIFILKKWL